MPNDNVPTPNNPPPPSSNGGEQPKRSVLLIIKDLIRYEGPLGPLVAILLTFVVTIFLTYFATLLWVIPKHVVILADPIIEKVLTAQPPPTVQPSPTSVPSLVVVNKQLHESVSYCVTPKDMVYLRIEPQPSSSGTQYEWSVSKGAVFSRIDVGQGDLEVKTEKIGERITVDVCFYPDAKSKLCFPSKIFLVQEVCSP